jgi:hypothetical protein
MYIRERINITSGSRTRRGVRLGLLIAQVLPGPLVEPRLGGKPDSANDGHHIYETRDSIIPSVSPKNIQPHNKEQGLPCRSGNDRPRQR